MLGQLIGREYESLNMAVMKRMSGLLLLAALLLPQLARADALVLVHGYLGDANSWFSSGVAQGLQKAGWHFGGNLTASRQGIGVQGGQASAGPGDKLFYVMTLPSEAPLEVQISYLEPMLKAVRKRHPDEPLSIAGHSLGGLLGRYAMVRDPDLKVTALITIASPHLGTDKAELALLAGSTPLSMMAPMLGAGTINRSRSLYAELVPQKPGNFLGWLNYQQHPQALYFSVIRTGSGSVSIGDMVVPAYSQNMNNVIALRGSSLVARSAEGHTLAPGDARHILLALQRVAKQ